MAHRRWWLNFSCKFRCSFLSMQISTAVVFTDRFCISAPKHSLVGQTVIKVEKTKKKKIEDTDGVQGTGASPPAK